MMMSGPAALLTLMTVLAPLVFVLWAVFAAVGALKRIAKALETLSEGQLQVSQKTRLKKSDDPAYKYIPK